MCCHMFCHVLSDFWTWLVDAARFFWRVPDISNTPRIISPLGKSHRIAFNLALSWKCSQPFIFPSISSIFFSARSIWLLSLLWEPYSILKIPIVSWEFLKYRIDSYSILQLVSTEYGHSCQHSAMPLQSTQKHVCPQRHQCQSNCKEINGNKRQGCGQDLRNSRSKPHQSLLACGTENVCVYNNKMCIYIYK